MRLRMAYILSFILTLHHVNNFECTSLNPALEGEEFKFPFNPSSIFSDLCEKICYF